MDGLSNESVSIIIPTYNCEKYISETVRSVLAQTYREFEVLLIDDGSSDSTLSLLNSLKEMDRRIRVFRNEKNMGSAKTRNRGVEYARYDWIALIDADDCWEPDKLEKQMHFIAHHPDARFIFTGSAFMNSDGERLSSILHVPEKVNFYEELGQNRISCSSVLIKKELLRVHPMPSDPGIHEDYATWLMILETGEIAYGLDEPLLIYRVHPESKSANKLKAAMMHWNCYAYISSGWKGKISGMMRYAVSSVRKFSRMRDNLK